MTPRLDIEGKQALLEQSLKLRYSNTFGKILFTKRCCINLARSRSVYRFEADLYKGDVVIIRFGDHSGNEAERVKIKADQAIKLCGYLQPANLIARNCGQKEKKFIEFLEHFDCKVAISYLCSIPSFDLIERVWSRIVEIETAGCWIHILDGFPTKSFEKLEIGGIKSPDQLQKALRHNVKNLVLYIHHNLVQQTNLSGIHALVSEKNIEHCRIVLGWQISKEPALMFVRSLVELLRSNMPSTNFEVIRSHSALFHCYSTGEIIQKLISDVNWITEMAKVTNEAKVNSTIKIPFHYKHVYGPKVSWVCELKKNPSLEDIRAEVEEKCKRVYLKLERRIGKTNIKFDSVLCY